MDDVAANSERGSPGVSSLTFARLYSNLENAHAVLRESAMGLARTCERRTPDEVQCTSAHYKISHGNLEKRAASNAVYNRIVPFLTQAERNIVSDLVAYEVELSSYTHNHMAIWTTEKVARDWEQYRGASQTMRWKLLTIANREKALLYPFLARLADREDQ